MKPYLCRFCGEADPTQFYGSNKGQCRICFRATAREYQKSNFLRTRWHGAKSRATTAGLEFSISSEDIEALWDSQKGKCHYTGLQMTNDLDGFTSVSIDRLSSEEGYTRTNVVLCRSICNRIKHGLTKELFLLVISQIHHHSNLQQPAPEPSESLAAELAKGLKYKK